MPYTIVNVNAPIYGSDGINGFLVNNSFWGYSILKYPTSGTSAINLSGFSGKTVLINNTSIVQGGKGGNGGNGGSYLPQVGIYCQAKIFYGAVGGIAISNSNGVNLSISGNSIINGNNGLNGTYYDNCKDANSG